MWCRDRGEMRIMLGCGGLCRYLECVAVGSREHSLMGIPDTCRASRLRSGLRLHPPPSRCSSPRRGGPMVFTFAYLREARWVHRTLHNASWETQPILVGGGLAQRLLVGPTHLPLGPPGLHSGYSGAMLSLRGRGLDLQSATLPRLAWADDTWELDAGSRRNARRLATRSVVRCRALHQVGELQLCQLQPGTSPSSTDMRHVVKGPNRHKFDLRAHIGRHGTACRTPANGTVRRRCWQASYLHQRVWSVCACVTANSRMHHLASFLMLGWCAGSRYWNRRDPLQGSDDAAADLQRSDGICHRGEETI